jgi:hypothetical protein
MTWNCRYGPAPKNSDSAINILLDIVADQSGKTYKMDHWAQRYPTNVVDIANFLVRLVGQYKLAVRGFARSRHYIRLFLSFVF